MKLASRSVSAPLDASLCIINAPGRHHHQRRISLTTVAALGVCLLLLATVAFDVAQSAATGCATGETAEAAAPVSGSASREGRSAQEQAAAQRSLLRMLPKAEKARAEECNPYTSRCCQGMRCANYMGGYCMASYEKCICFPSQGPGDNN